MSEEVSLSPETGSTSVHENLQSSKSHALQAAEELRAAATAKAQQLKDATELKASHLRDVAGEKAAHLKEHANETAHKVREAAGTNWEDARVKAKQLQAETEEYVRENPTKAILTAVGIGFVIGLIFRR